MAFNSLNYALFFTLVLLVTWSLARLHMLRLFILVAASCFSYMCSRKIYILLVAIPTVVDYFVAFAIHAAESRQRKKAWLALSMTMNLGLLGAFKYYDFFVQSIAEGLAALHLVSANASLPLLEVALPVGISFYTFQTMAYVIDVYRGTQVPIRDFVKFALLITFFPHFVAGPIVLARELVPQFDRPARITVQQVGDGVFLILRGLVKKVAIADYLGRHLVDPVYSKPYNFSALEVLLALVAYSMQIYGDFSGYTDIARGSAKLLGYELPENFDRPYLAQSVAHFWRRWHMTLSRWVREYIYFPLGGTHKGQVRAYLNIMITLVIMGLWHGAKWTFFWYGVIHGILVAVNRWSNQRRVRQGLSDEVHGVSLVWRIAATFTFVTLARILFRSQSLAHAWAVTKRLLHGDWAIEHIQAADLRNVLIVLGLSYAIHWTPRRWIERCRELFVLAPPVTQGLALASVGALVLNLSSGQPPVFIYFAF